MPLDLGQDFSEQALIRRHRRHDKIANALQQVPSFSFLILSSLARGRRIRRRPGLRHRNRVTVGEDVVGLSGVPDVIGFKLEPTDACVTRAVVTLGMVEPNQSGNLIVRHLHVVGQPFVYFFGHLLAHRRQCVNHSHRAYQRTRSASSIHVARRLRLLRRMVDKVDRTASLVRNDAEAVYDLLHLLIGVLGDAAVRGDEGIDDDVVNALSSDRRDHLADSLLHLYDVLLLDRHY